MVIDSFSSNSNAQKEENSVSKIKDENNIKEKYSKSKNSETTTLINMKQVVIATPNPDKSSKFKYIIVDKTYKSQCYNLISFTPRQSSSSNIQTATQINEWSFHLDSLTLKIQEYIVNSLTAARNITKQTIFSICFILPVLLSNIC